MTETEVKTIKPSAEVTFRSKDANGEVTETVASKTYTVDFAVTYTDDDIEWVRAQRKYWARREQEETEKVGRKTCQKYVKATTIVIDYMTSSERLKLPLPIELENLIKATFCFVQAEPRIEFTDVQKRGEELFKKRMKELRG
jgi:hypothetical protein